MITEIVEIRHRIIRQQANERYNSTEYTTHSMIPAGGPVMRRMDANVTIEVSRASGQIFVNNVSFTFGIIRPKYGLMKGVKLMDQDAIIASITKSAILFLERYLKRSLTIPATDKFATYQDLRGCTRCRFYKAPRMGSDEMEFDFTDEEGDCLRDMSGMDSLEVPPQMRCGLFGFWIEEHFELLSELNRMLKAGTRSGLANIRIGYDSWPTERNRRRMPLTADPDDTWPNEQHEEAINMDPTGEWANLYWLREQMFKDRSCEHHRWWNETIPWGWMPTKEGGVLLPGGVVLRNA